MAYAAWLTERLNVEGSKLQVWRSGKLEDSTARSASVDARVATRLPTDAEWLRLAGGEKDGKRNRYPWDVSGSDRVTDYESESGKKAILARANTDESGIHGTSPVAMYPLGESKLFGLWDVAGNVWEWIGSWYDKEQVGRVLRGGSWVDLSSPRSRRHPQLGLSGLFQRQHRLSVSLPYSFWLLISGDGGYDNESRGFIESFR